MRLRSNQVLAGKPGVRIDTEWKRDAGFLVRRVALPVKNIVGAELHELCTEIVGDMDKVQNCGSVDAVCQFRIALAIVDAMIRRQIDNDVRTHFLQRGSRATVIGHIESAARERMHVVLGKSDAQVLSQLSIGAKYGDPHDEVEKVSVS